MNYYLYGYHISQLQLKPKPIVMRSVTFILLTMAITSATYCQSNWITKKIGDNITVRFPKEPNSDTKPDKRLTLYVVKSETSNCMFTVIAKQSAVPNYERIKKLALEDQKREFNEFLDKGIQDLIHGSKVISPSKQVGLNRGIGREIIYNQTNTGESVFQYARIILIDNNLYLIQCSMYSKGACEVDKNQFLNSITTY